VALVGCYRPRPRRIPVGVRRHVVSPWNARHDPGATHVPTTAPSNVASVSHAVGVDWGTRAGAHPAGPVVL
jgi:hypothetical protein